MKRQKILIACVGNIFLGDDGFGVEVAAALTRAGLEPEARLVDYGIRGLDLAYALLEPWDSVVLVDVVERGGQPGTVYLLQPAGTDPSSTQSGLDPHAMDPARVLATARLLGTVTAEVYIVGCEPRDFGDELDGRMGLSPEVAAAVPQALRVIQDLLQRLREPAAIAAAG